METKQSFSPINESIDSGLQSSSRSKSCFRGIQAQSYQTKLPNIVVSCLQSSLINIGVCWGGSIVTCQNLSEESGFLCKNGLFTSNLWMSNGLVTFHWLLKNWESSKIYYNHHITKNVCLAVMFGDPYFLLKICENFPCKNHATHFRTLLFFWVGRWYGSANFRRCPSTFIQKLAEKLRLPRLPQDAPLPVINGCFWLL